MKIIGIDASLTCTGICTFADPYIIGVSRTVTSKPAEGLAGRIKRYQQAAEEIHRIADPSGTTCPHVFLEGYSWGSPHKAIPLAEFGAILRQRLLSQNCTIIEVSPNEVKKFATGKGKGDKALIQAHVAKRWNLIFETSDEADAFVLGRIGLAYHGLAECDNEAQREVIERMKNPPAKKIKKRRVTYAE